MTGLVSRGVPGRRALHAHNAVFEQAKELCLSAYEALMAENEVWTEWQRRHPGFSRRHLELAFVRKYVFSFVAPARALLAARLSAPIDNAAKTAIYDALLLDGTLMRGRGRALK